MKMKMKSFYSGFSGIVRKDLQKFGSSRLAERGLEKK